MLVWTDVARDLALVAAGGAASVHRPRAARGDDDAPPPPSSPRRPGRGPPTGWSGRGTLIAANVSPELVLDDLALAWPQRQGERRVMADVADAAEVARVEAMVRGRVQGVGFPLLRLARGHGPGPRRLGRQRVRTGRCAASPRARATGSRRCWSVSRRARRARSSNASTRPGCPRPGPSGRSPSAAEVTAATDRATPSAALGRGRVGYSRRDHPGRMVTHDGAELARRGAACPLSRHPGSGRRARTGRRSRARPPACAPPRRGSTRAPGTTRPSTA